MMTSQGPLVSIIMNCYNGENYLSQAIDSVISQKYTNWEIIFWDNQSTDRSAQIVKGYSDPRIKYIYAGKHTPLYEARNYAISESSGELIAFLDVDDWWEKYKLEQQVRLFSDSEVGVVCSNFWVVNERKNKKWPYLKKPLRTGWVLDDVMKDYGVGLLTLIIRRSAFDALDSPCNPNYHIIGDFDLVIRLLVNWKLDYVHQSLAYYRVHENNETGKNRSRHVKELEDWMRNMSAFEDINGCHNFEMVTVAAAYIKAMDYLLAGDRLSAFEICQSISFGKEKVRLLLAFLLPKSWLKKFKN